MARTITLSIVYLTSVLAMSIRSAPAAEQVTVWIGTTTPRSGASKGIYRATLDLESGALTTPTLAAAISSPGFVTVHSDGRYLYSVCGLPGRQGGGVAAFEISKDRKYCTILQIY